MTDEILVVTDTGDEEWYDVPKRIANIFVGNHLTICPQPDAHIVMGEHVRWVIEEGGMTTDDVVGVDIRIAPDSLFNSNP